MNRRTFITAAAAVVPTLTLPSTLPASIRCDNDGLPIAPDGATWDEWADAFSEWERDAFRKDKPYTWRSVRERIVCRWNPAVTVLIVMHPDRKAIQERDDALALLGTLGGRTLGTGHTPDRHVSMAFVAADSEAVEVLLADWIIEPPPLSWELDDAIDCEDE